MLPSHSVPPDSSWFSRQLDGLRESLREGLASVAKSIAPQIEFLLTQTTSQEANPGSVTTITINPATTAVPTTWLPFSAASDAVLIVRTTSTGKLSFQAAGYLQVVSIEYPSVQAFIGVEILKGGVTVRNPYFGDGNSAVLQSKWGSMMAGGVGQAREVALTPDTEYTLRCRRGYQTTAGTAGAIATINYQGTEINVTKLGM